MGPSQGLSWASLWQLHLQCSPSICLSSIPGPWWCSSSVLVPCPGFCHSVGHCWWALSTPPWRWGAASVTSWGDPVWVGCWQHTQRHFYAFTSLFDTSVRADAALLWVWFVTGILCPSLADSLGGSRSLPPPGTAPASSLCTLKGCWGVDRTFPAQWHSLGMLTSGRKAF